MQVFNNTYITLHHADARQLPIPDESVDCVVTSPPYFGLRDYQLEGEGIGLESTPDLYVQNLVKVFREVWRVLKPTGTVWLNLGDSYHNYRADGAYPKQTVSKTKQDLPTFAPHRGHHVEGLKSKDLMGIPWRVAFALQADGWYLRSDIIWSKPNPMPESVQDRPTKAHEYIFLLTKNARYYYDADAIREPIKRLWDSNNGGPMAHPTHEGIKKSSGYSHVGEYPLPNPLGANKRSVWEIATQPYPEAHFATYPEKLVEPCILSLIHISEPTRPERIGGGGVWG